MGAGRDVNLTAGVETAYAYDESYSKKRGLLSSKTTHIIQSTDQTRAQASTFTGESTVVMAGRDANVARTWAHRRTWSFRWPGGEHPPGENTSQDYDYKRVKKSGLGAMGGLSIGTRRQTDSVDGKQVFHTASTVGSVEGNVLIKAGNGLNVGSNVIARQGDVTLIGQQVNIVAALDTARSKEFHEIKQSGLSVTASNPVVSAVQTGERMASAASKVDNPVMQGLAAGTAGLAAYNAYDAVQKMGSLDKATSLDKVGGVSVQISLGSSRAPAPPNATHPARRAPPSRRAGPDHHRPGRGPELGHHRHGFEPVGRRQRRTKAEGDVLLQAARNAFEQKTDSKSSSASIGVGFNVGSANTGVTLELGVSASRARPTAGRKLDQQPCCRWQHAGVPIWRRYDAEGRIGQGRPDHRVGGRQPAAGEPAGHQQYDAKNQSAGFGASICLTGHA